MAFVKIEDQTGKWKSFYSLMRCSRPLAFGARPRGAGAWPGQHPRPRFGQPSDEVKVMADDAREITVAQATGYQSTGKKAKVPKPTKKKVDSGSQKAESKTLYLRLASSQEQQKLVDLKKILDANPGKTGVVLVLGAGESRQAIKLPTGCSASKEALELLGELVSQDNLRHQ